MPLRDADAGIERTSGLTTSRTVPVDERRCLSAEAIVDAAYRMIDEEGLAAFTMRSLGGELGVSAMAVYGYFSSRDELLAAVLSKFMDTMDTDPVPGERWDDTLRRTMTSIHLEYCRHPNIGAIDVGPQVAFRGLSKHTEKIIDLHLGQGMPESILGQAWAIIDAYLGGFNAGAIEKARHREEFGSVDDLALPLWQRIVCGAYDEEAFRSGVEILIQGIRGLAAPDPCEWYTPA